VIPNEKLLAVAKDAGFFESFRIADDVLRQGVQGISDIITIPGVINRDFADVKTTMAGMGYAVMGTAMRSGADRAVEAAMAAMASPLLEAGAIDGARGILINITGSSSLKLSEVNEASSIIQDAAHEDANIIFGAVLDETMGDDVKITVIATGFKQQQMPQRRERMLAEATLPTMRYDVPIQPRVSMPRAEAPRAEVARVEAPRAEVARVETARAETIRAEAPRAETMRAEVPRAEVPRFASEPVPEPPMRPVVPVVEAQPQSKGIPEYFEPELRSVPASVFDDDFFRHALPPEEDVDVIVEAPRVMEVRRRESDMPERFREPTHHPAPLRVQQEDVRIVADAAHVGDPVVRGPSFGGAADQAEPDELDIPAFLRRGK
jgi:cell division protein FtsZ